MLFRGECIRSCLGFGQVLTDGHMPMIRFLDGRVCRIPENAVTILPAEMFESEISNRTKWNRLLTLYVSGPRALDEGGELWKRDRDGIWSHRDDLSDDDSHPSGVMKYFLQDEMVVSARDAPATTDDDPGNRIQTSRICN